jgi:hypothetical protein
VDADVAFRAFAACDPLAEIEREGFHSAFQFGDDFADLMKLTGSCRGFNGACWSPWIWFDIDREGNLDSAFVDARRLASFVVDRYQLDEEALLLFFSGRKGAHIGLPTSLFQPAPSPTFHRVTRRFAEQLAESCGVQIDRSVYDRVRAFRAPNSRHPKSGLHKRRLSFGELLNLSVDRIVDLARRPEPFDVPTPPSENDRAKADWQEAMAAAGNRTTPRPSAVSRSTLNRGTLDFIREGAADGERHTRLFQAAANLAEFGCPGPLAHALLTEAALDSGLPPAEARRQIDCGLAHVGPRPIETTAAPPPSTAPTSPTDLQTRLAALWQSANAVNRSAKGVDEPMGHDRGDAHEPSGDDLAKIDPDALAFDFGANATPGPYGGDRR